MERVTLRRAGGSLTLTVPAPYVRAMGLAEGASLDVSMEDGKLVAAPAAAPRPRYTLDELLARCDPAADVGEDDQTWLDDGAVGDEVL